MIMISRCLSVFVFFISLLHSLLSLLLFILSQKEEEECQVRERRTIAETKKREELERRKREVMAYSSILYSSIYVFIIISGRRCQTERRGYQRKGKGHRPAEVSEAILNFLAIFTYTHLFTGTGSRRHLGEREKRGKQSWYVVAWQGCHCSATQQGAFVCKMQ